MTTCFSILVVLSALSLPACAQYPPLPASCESSAELRKALHIEWAPLNKLAYTDRIAKEHDRLAENVANYPREPLPYRQFVNFVRYQQEPIQPGSLADLQRKYKQQAEAHSDDPWALYQAGFALVHTDTPEAVRLLESVRKKAPQFPWAAIDLSGIYSSEKFADKQKAAQEAEVFWAACPAATDGEASMAVSRSQILQAKVAVALRVELEKETDPDRLEQYEYLWGLEFRSRPPQEHDAERKQVAADLKRLETLNSKPNAEWQNFLIGGYKQSGASPAEITAMEGRLLQKFPRSDEAFEILSERWEKEHKTPDSQADTAAWDAHWNAYETAVRGWISQFPDLLNLQRAYGFYAISQAESVPQAEGIATASAFVANDLKYNSPDGYGEMQAAEFLLDHHWDPALALVWLEEARQMAAKGKAALLTDDELKDPKSDFFASQVDYLQRDVTRLMLLAAMRADQPSAVQPLRASVEGPLPTDKAKLPDYWLNRARLAVIDGRRQDAMTYYQLALSTRSDPPHYQYGRLKDEAGDEARALWKDLGGSTAAWQAWSDQSMKRASSEQSVRWQKPKLTLSPFELTDLSGKAWKLSELKGKVVIVNLWATWCGPCEQELPSVQKLYEKLNGRADVQLLTFNIDDDLGLVEPFVKQNGYTFPVLAASTYVTNLLPEIEIPQTWLVDEKGNWQWTQKGYGGDDSWDTDLVKKAASMKSGGSSGAPTGPG